MHRGIYLASWSASVYYALDVMLTGDDCSPAIPGMMGRAPSPRFLQPLLVLA